MGCLVGNFDSSTKSVTVHLRNVYGSLALCLLAAAGGVYVLMYFALSHFGLLTLLASLGLLILIMTSAHDPRQCTKTMLRLGYLLAFAVLAGIALGRIIYLAISTEPTILGKAFAGTSVIFICFILVALLLDDLQYIYMGEFLLAALFWLLILGVMNLFFQSLLIWNIYMYGGLVLMCAFVLYDTQMIVVKRKLGDYDDYVWHSLYLFLDFLAIFKHSLIILIAKETGRRN